MFAADAELEIGTSLPTKFAGHLDQLADASLDLAAEFFAARLVRERRKEARA